MGSGQSGLSIKPSDENLSLRGMGLTVIKHKIPAKNNLQNLDVSENKLNSLPPSFPELRHLNLSQNYSGQSVLSISLENALLSYTKLIDLDLSYNGYFSLPKSLEVLPLKALHVHCNHLSELPLFQFLEELEADQNIFVSCPTLSQTLKRLFINYNRLESFDFNLPELEIFEGRMNCITRFQGRQTFDNLHNIDLSMNKIRNFPDFTIWSPNLQRIYASYNLSTHFPNFPESIIIVDLSYNSITELPDDLDKYTNLLTLKIASNRLTRIPQLPPTLRTFVCCQNPITDIFPGEFPTLSEFYAFQTKIEQLPPFKNTVNILYFFPNCCIKHIDLSFINEKIVQLTLRDNQIEELPVELFSLPHLTTLMVAGNKIREIPDAVKDSTIRILNVSENPLLKLPDEFPPSLQRLSCGTCGLKSIPASVASLQELEHLNINNNELTEIECPPKLRVLFAPCNQITTFPTLSFSVTKVDLSCNKIQSIPTAFDNPELVELELSFNELRQIPTSYNCPHLQVFKVAHNSECVGEFPCEQFPHLETLDVSYSKVTFTPSTAVREIITENAELYTSQMFKLVDTSYCCYAEMCGGRDTMEDAILVRPHIVAGADAFVVFDGHGGSLTSNWCVYEMTKLLAENPTFNGEFLKKVISKLTESLKAQEFPDGATMAAAFINNDQLISAHLGDSRVMLVDVNGAVRFVTDDHKPTKREEFERINEINGRVEKLRTGGVLAIARSMGDFAIHGVSREPCVKRVLFTPEDRWVIVACDGVFDVMMNETIGELCTRAQDARELSYLLRNYAFHRGSTDNISAIAIDLKQRAQQQ